MIYKILVLLMILSFISIHIPHKSKKYNLSCHSRLLGIITSIWVLITFIYFIFSILSIGTIIAFVVSFFIAGVFGGLCLFEYAIDEMENGGEI